MIETSSLYDEASLSTKEGLRRTSTAFVCSRSGPRSFVVVTVKTVTKFQPLLHTIQFPKILVNIIPLLLRVPSKFYRMFSPQNFG